MKGLPRDVIGRVQGRRGQDHALGPRLAALLRLLSVWDRYEPGRHYMRGPGPKALAKARTQQNPAP